MSKFSDLSHALIFQHAYSKPVRTSDLECKDPSLTQQQFSEDADINVLLQRFRVTGQLPPGGIQPVFGDFSQAIDFRSASDAILKAQRSFMELPATIRARFSHDPGAFLEFTSDPANLSELRKMGLALPDRGIGGVAPDVKPSDKHDLDKS
jgi:phage internal scaffolding protein